MGQQVCKHCGLPSLSDPSEETSKFLSQVTLFKGLPAATQRTLGMIATTVEFKPNDYIIKQGELGEDFWVIMRGKCAVLIDGQRMATLRHYDYFGEKALLQEEPRSATIQAIEPVSALKIMRNHFQSFGIQEQLRFAHRKAVGGHVDKQNQEARPPSPKTPEERKLMSEAIKNNKLLKNLTDNQIAQIIDVAWKEHVPANLEIITEGDENVDYFYIVQEGTFEVFVRDDRGGSAMLAVARAKMVNEITKGGSFGEMALLHRDPRTATVRAVTSAVVFVVDRGSFQAILEKSDEDFLKEHAVYLEGLDILKELSASEKEAVAKVLTDVSLSKDEIIFKQGEQGEAFYILVEGEVKVIEDGVEVRSLTASPEKVAFFGERALLGKEPRSATVQVVSESAKALTLDKESFDMLLGPLEELKKLGKDRPEATEAGTRGRLMTYSQPATDRQFGLIHMSDLNHLGLLGCGGFGAVTMVEHRETGDTYALKQLSKGYVLKTGMQSSITSEKDVQLLCDSHFIVKLFETYNSKESLYFLLELALGGELYATYNRKGFHGSVQHAHFYLAGVVFAFEHLHSKKVIYRDLKPENLLLTEKGRVKLTDMGLAKVVIGKSYTTCGTPDYFAPEMVGSCGHNQAVDWWTLGILTFELMTGHPPFESATAMLIYQKVQAGIDRVHFPKGCKGAAEDLVKNLCQRSPSKRLPMKVGGIDNIKKHSWFSDFSWEKMWDNTLEPPYLPAVQDKRDLKNFNVRKEDMPPQIAYKDPGTGWDKNFATSD
mmetsp:Transcript_96553/g.201752  ORF Transcript_96553/g.201752 Transcript_96553/m.201752 type:complete len:771 (+) Transcript_96553:341-2653(+)|eukprot:CAMPEP_0206469104 /NCGR_PEP_ID=MMETSP0324_2-20121206/30056_1 /ASSEMBLY_ACC=CAM_ASM_000836 /TAXON_ID=2866 /ORGANISM="Crypthecodinium cohnii, Strain Seligo" /LENGTH=770 /DNA_ID=CAMNT_0053942749 /DNA_START=334 /DNA_END=2646 /DNA_ORIENTATION=+